MHEQDFLTNSSSSTFLIDGGDGFFQTGWKNPFCLHRSLLLSVFHPTWQVFLCSLHLVFKCFKLFDKPLITEVWMKQSISVFPRVFRKAAYEMKMLNNTSGIPERKGIILLHLYSLFKKVVRYDHSAEKKLCGFFFFPSHEHCLIPYLNRWS